MNEHIDYQFLKNRIDFLVDELSSLELVFHKLLKESITINYVQMGDFIFKT